MAAMTYEELRQRCLNYARMHPTNPAHLADMVLAVMQQPDNSQRDFMLELARFIDVQYVDNGKIDT